MCVVGGPLEARSEASPRLHGICVPRLTHAGAAAICRDAATKENKTNTCWHRAVHHVLFWRSRGGKGRGGGAEGRGCRKFRRPPRGASVPDHHRHRESENYQALSARLELGQLRELRQAPRGTANEGDRGQRGSLFSPACLCTNYTTECFLHCHAAAWLEFPTRKTGLYTQS